MESLTEMLEDWDDPQGYHSLNDAEDIIDKLRTAVILLIEDMETIDRMPFQSLEEVADFAEMSVKKHKEYISKRD